MSGSDARVFAGRYRAVRRLGAGGTATVFLARDERLEREVAVMRDVERMRHRLHRLEEGERCASGRRSRVIGIGILAWPHCEDVSEVR